MEGQRLENLSWRLWHLQNLMVDTDNARSKREFKKLSRCMGDKLDKEKGRSIEELEAPDFKRNHSSEMIRQRAAEKERNREASQNAQPGTIKRMQFTFSIDQPISSALSSTPAKKPDNKPSAEFNKRPKVHNSTAARAQQQAEQASASTAGAKDDAATSSTTTTTTTTTTITNDTTTSATSYPASLHFPGLFNNDFGPSALLNAAPTLTNRMNYGEGFNPSTNNDQFSISRPTIELTLDDLLFSDDGSNEASHYDWNAGMADNTSTRASDNQTSENYETTNAPSAAEQQQDIVMAPPQQSTSFNPAETPITYMTANGYSVAGPTASAGASSAQAGAEDGEDSLMSEEEDTEQPSPAPGTVKKSSVFKSVPPLSQAVKDILPETIAPSRVSSIYGTRSSTPTNRPALTVRTQAVNTRSSGPSATATSLNPALLRGNSSTAGNSAPGGVKAECSNCGATHTPLWRRGLNDELNCNACGLYCKLHKRPRPKSMRNSHGESRAQVAPRQQQEAVDVMGMSNSPRRTVPLFTEDKVRQSVAAQCYNCHTTATPLWRKDDEGKTVCNACGLYYKLHGSARPISMKSDVIRKRSRHDATRRSTAGPEDTPSASPGVSRRPSPVPETSPTLAPDSTTQMTYEYTDEAEYRSAVVAASSSSSSSELMNALGHNNANANDTSNTGASTAMYATYALAGQYPDILTQMYTTFSETTTGEVEIAAPSTSSSSASVSSSTSPRSNKRRRLSTDSGSEPPSSAVSFSSYSGDSYSSTSSSHSKRASAEFPFAAYNTNGTINAGPALRGSGNTFWHPPMMPQSTANDEPAIFQHMTSGSSTTSSSSSSSNVGGSTPGSSSSSISGGMEDGDSPMDYLHPPMGLQDEDSLFSAYLHPPMSLPADDGRYPDGFFH
ncbi:hypothetical protein D9613_003762 [Agrocybe pediades]|uniref:GATA-type domain-containing protein n=1 Tax=Agrocybe pediades TaxID=84607 RepID=A0A8H4QIF2_9AGAR|nr:hypothetical protein D9613_003762 [Agrocybe pediades]